MFWRNLIMKVQPNQRERGAGLVIVMFAGILVAGIVGATTTMLANQTKERVLEARKNQRDTAFEFVKSSLTDPSAIRVSSKFDTNLRACIGLRRDASGRPLSNTQCTAGMSSATAKPTMRAFQLFVPFSRTQGSVQVSASSSSDPKGFYDQRGRMVPGNCAPSAACPYQIRTWYWAQCPNNTATCGEAVRIFSYAQIHQVFDIDTKTTGYVYPKESQRVDKPYEKASFILTSDVADSIYMNCPEGAVLIGTSEVEDPSKAPGAAPLNLARCACAQGYALDKTKGAGGYDTATGWPYCKMAGCDAAAGEVLSEIDINGEIKCKIPKKSDYICNKYSIPTNNKVECPPNYKMRGFFQGADCIIVNSNGAEIVSCSTTEITCCLKK